MDQIVSGNLTFVHTSIDGVVVVDAQPFGIEAFNPAKVLLSDKDKGHPWLSNLR